MKLLEGRTGLVLGIANARSLGWAIAQAAAHHGAKIGLNYHSERLARRVRPLAEQIGAAFVAPCDVTDDAQMDALFAQAADAFDGQLDFIVHSLAFADREDLQGRFRDTRREGYALAMDVSAYSLVALTRRAAPLMKGGGSVVSLSYIGAERVVPHYKVMGPAKAALEATVRGLAHDLGAEGIRVNAISAGPVKTLAAAGIPQFRSLLKVNAERTALGRNITTGEVADAAVFLLSSMSSGITGEVIHVDAGFHAMA